MFFSDWQNRDVMLVAPRQMALMWGIQSNQPIYVSIWCFFLCMTEPTKLTEFVAFDLAS